MRYSTRWTMGTPLLLAASTLAAQETGTPQSDPAIATLDQVVVTAQKRQESLQEVPISATVLDDFLIEQMQVRSVADVAMLAPNVSFADSGFAGTLDLTFRGVQNLGGQVNAYGIYLDEFSLAPSGSAIAVDPLLLDIERIEVLRGPQGVAFGRNVIGGAISMTTRKPGKELEAEVAGGWSRFGTWYLRAAAGGPLSERVGIRVSGYGAGSGGYIRDIGPAGNRNDYDRRGGRLALRFEPTDTLTIDLAADRSVDEYGAQSNVASAAIDPNAPGLAGLFGVAVPALEGQGTWPGNRHLISNDFPARQKIERDLLQLGARWELGDHALNVVAGHLHATRLSREDADFTAGSYTAHTDDDSLRTSSLELRMSGPVTGNLDYLAGVLHSRDVTRSYFTFQFGPDGFAGINALLDAFINPGLIADGRPPLPYYDLSYQEVNYSPTMLETRSTAVFADLSWRITPRSQLLAGARLTRDDTRSQYVRGGMFSPAGLFSGDPVPFEARGAGEAQHTAVTPRLAYNFKINPNVTAYASVTRGYKSGGFNSAALATAAEAGQDLSGVDLAYDPEYAWAYEAGLKAELFNRRLRVNTAAFHTDWSDLQVGVFDLQAFSILTLNAAKARLQGVEVDWVALLGSGWRAYGGLGLLDAKFNEFPDAQFGGTSFDATGNYLPTAPRVTGYVAAEYYVPVDLSFAGESLSLFVRGDYAYQGSRHGTITNDPAYELDAYGVFNFGVGIEGEALRVALYLRNALDEKYFTSYSGDVPFSGWRVDTHPRTWGVEFRYRFR